MSELIERGEFTLNPERALEMLGDHLLPTREHYLLLWTQAAYLLGAPELQVEIGRFGVTYRFQSTRDLPSLELARHIHSVDDRAIQSLALGVRVASRGVGKVTIESSSGFHVFAKDGSWKEIGGGGDEVVLRVSRFRWDTGPELRLLRRACAWSPLPVRINGVSAALEYWGDRATLAESYLPGQGLAAPAASFALHPPRVCKEHLGRRVPCRIALSLSNRGAPTQLIWVRYGVVIHQEERDLGLPGLSAVLCADDLTTDLTGFQLGEGEDLEKRIEEVRVEAHAMLERTRRKESDVSADL